MKRLLLSLTLIGALALTLIAAPEAATPVRPSVAKNSLCFELRTYTAAPGKLEALNARFRDHTNALFKKHGMKVVAYWMPTDKEQGADNKLIYVLSHKSREAAVKSWAAFQADPEWQKAKAASEVNGTLIVTVESVFMAATDYSPLK